MLSPPCARMPVNGVMADMSPKCGFRISKAIIIVVIIMQSVGGLRAAAACRHLLHRVLSVFCRAFRPDGRIAQPRRSSRSCGGADELGVPFPIRSPVAGQPAVLAVLRYGAAQSRSPFLPRGCSVFAVLDFPRTRFSLCPVPVTQCIPALRAPRIDSPARSFGRGLY